MNVEKSLFSIAILGSTLKHNKNDIFAVYSRDPLKFRVASKFKVAGTYIVDMLFLLIGTASATKPQNCTNPPLPQPFPIQSWAQKMPMI